MRSHRKHLDWLCLAALLAACAPSHRYTDAEVATAPRLKDIMWSQAQLTDPQWKKIGRSQYSDADFAAFADVGKRLEMTTARIRKDFSRGPAFDQLAGTLAEHAAELGQAAAARDAAKASAALAALRQTCRTCHAKFR
jgi:cytochrome c556